MTKLADEILARCEKGHPKGLIRWKPYDIDEVVDVVLDVLRMVVNDLDWNPHYEDMDDALLTLIDEIEKSS
jgi:hypothetical protein